MESIFFLISIISLIVTTAIAIILSRKHEIKTKIKPIYVLIGGVFLAIFTIMLYVDYQPETYGKASTFFLAIFHAVQIMLTGYEFDSLQGLFSVGNEYFSLEYLYISADG